MGSVQDFILLSLCMVQIRRIRRQEQSKIPNTNDGNILRRPSTSYNKALGRAAFGIIYVASAKSWVTRGASHQPAFMDTCLTISHTCLACLPSTGCSIKCYWIESHMEFCQTSATELLWKSMWSVFRWIVFLRCGELVLVYVLWRVGPVLRNGYGI